MVCAIPEGVRRQARPVLEDVLATQTGFNGRSVQSVKYAARREVTGRIAVEASSLLSLQLDTVNGTPLSELCSSDSPTARVDPYPQMASSTGSGAHRRDKTTQ